MRGRSRKGSASPSGLGDAVAQEWTAAGAFARLLRRLGLSELSRREALTFLRRKGCPDELAEAAVARAVADRFIDDRRVEEALHAKAERVGWSQKQLHAKSRLKGLSEPQAVDESSACRQLAETWLRRGVAPERVAGRLMQRGFSSRLVRSTLLACQAAASGLAPQEE